jgi:hypothetical protein
VIPTVVSGSAVLKSYLPRDSTRCRSRGKLPATCAHCSSPLPHRQVAQLSGLLTTYSARITLPSISKAAVCTGPSGASTMIPGRPLMIAKCGLKSSRHHASGRLRVASTRNAEQATDPGRMRPDFQRDPLVRHLAEDFAQCFRIRANSLLLLYLPRIRPARSTSCCDLLDPIQRLTSAETFSCSALPPRC